MNASAWVGLALGVVMGSGYGILQRRGTRHEAASPPRVSSLALWGIIRLVCLAVAVLLVLRLTTANQYWLIGGVMVSYAIVFLWSLKELISKKR